MKIKKKVKHFIWRICHDRLPVTSILRKRGLEVDDTCKVCGEGKETVNHLFFHCLKANIIWKLAPVRWEISEQQALSFKQWWSSLENAENSKEMSDRKELTAYILWHIWKNRNRWTFNAETWSEIDIVQGAWNEWIEYKAELPTTKREEGSSVRQEQRE